MRASILSLFLIACGGAAPEADEAPTEAAPSEAPAADATETETEAETADAETDAPDDSEWSHYGEAFAVDDVLPAKTLLADPSAYTDQTVRVEGRVADVCQKMGCWMVLTDDDGHQMRILMKDHAFSVDKAGTGKSCQVEGKVVAKAIDPEEVAHFESEASEGAPIPEKGVEGDTTYELVASGVAMRPAAM